MIFVMTFPIFFFKQTSNQHQNNIRSNLQTNEQMKRQPNVCDTFSTAILQNRTPAMFERMKILQVLTKKNVYTYKYLSDWITNGKKAFKIPIVYLFGWVIHYYDYFLHEMHSDFLCGCE